MNNVWLYRSKAKKDHPDWVVNASFCGYPWSWIKVFGDFVVGVYCNSPGEFMIKVANKLDPSDPHGGYRPILSNGSVGQKFTSDRLIFRDLDSTISYVENHLIPTLLGHECLCI